MIENKEKAYLRYLATHFETDKLEYKRLVASVKRETRKIKRQWWETFVSRIENDLNKSNENFKTAIPSNNYDRPKTTGECGMF